MKNYDDEIQKLNSAIKELNERVSKLEKKPTSEIDSSLDMNIAKNLKNLKNPQLVILSLKIEPNQTLEQIKNMLKKWGVDVTKWLAHGHFSDYILKKGFAYPTGKEKNKELFSLTSKGLVEFDTIKEKFQL